MDLIGLCSICGKPNAMHTCNICGILVCAKCFDTRFRICVNCKLGVK